jgi:TPR repeat protein
MQSDSTSLASTYLASTRRYLDLPDDPLERHQSLVVLKIECLELFQKLLRHAEDEGKDAWFAIGHGYSNGWGAARDRIAAETWFRRAAAGDHADAMVRLAVILSHPDRESDWKEGLEWLKRSARLGNASAMVKLGFAYREGRGVEVDLDLAESWFSKAYDAGDQHAAVHVGRLLAGYSSKPLEAVRWFHLAADAEQTESYVYLAMLYDDRHSDLYDPSKAVLWYRRVIEEGKCSAPRAMFELARHYRDGVGVVADWDRAAAWVVQLLETARKGSEFHREGLKLRDAMNSELF